MVRIDGASHMPIALVVVHRSEGTVDGQLIEVGTAEAGKLRIGVGE